MSGREISPGSVITLTDGRQGTVRFIGTTSFAVGDWIGVELSEATGKNDGAVQGERYFDCEPGYGMFIRPPAIAAVLQQPPRESKQTARVGPNAATNRQSQGGNAAGSKRPSGLPPTAVKRQSTNASGTPTPAPRMAPRSSLRVCLGLDSSGWPWLSTNGILFVVTHKVTDKAAIRCFQSYVGRRRSAHFYGGTQPTWTSSHHQILDGPVCNSVSYFPGFASLDGRPNNKNVETRVPKHCANYSSRVVQAPLSATDGSHKGI